MLKKLLLTLCVVSNFAHASGVNEGLSEGHQVMYTAAVAAVTSSDAPKKVKYADFLVALKRESEEADARLERALTLPLQDVAHACLKEWGIATPLTGTDPKSLFDLLVEESHKIQRLQNSDFGYTFLEKNKPIIHKFIQGERDWSKPLSIAEVGAGKGLSAIYLVETILHILRERSITPSLPIQIYVSDLLYGNHLRNLATVVNAAWGSHIQMTAQTLDLTTSGRFLARPADHMFAFNVFHYLPNTSWGNALRSMETSLKPGGTIAISVDELKDDAGKTSYLDLIDERDHAVNALKALLLRNPFHVPSFNVYDPLNGGKEKGFIISNYCSGSAFLAVPPRPCSDYGVECVVLENFRRSLVEYAKTRTDWDNVDQVLLKTIARRILGEKNKQGVSMDENSLSDEARREYAIAVKGRNTEKLNFGLGDKVTVTGLVSGVQRGQLRVLTGGYCFTEETLGFALEKVITPQLRIQEVRHFGAFAQSALQDRMVAVSAVQIPPRRIHYGILAILEKAVEQELTAADLAEAAM